MNATRPCPYCAEEIAAEAVRCPHCRTRLAGFDPERWHRAHPERRMAGVAAAVADGLSLSAGAIRLGFIVLTFLPMHVGPLLYGALWLVIPPAPGARSLVDRAIERVKDAVQGLRGRVTPSDTKPSPPALRGDLVP